MKFSVSLQLYSQFGLLTPTAISDLMFSSFKNEIWDKKSSDIGLYPVFGCYPEFVVVCVSARTQGWEKSVCY